MADCPTAEQLEGFASGTCGAEEASAIGAHVDGCDRCRVWVEDARADQGLLKRVRRVIARDAEAVRAGQGPASSDDSAVRTLRLEAAPAAAARPFIARYRIVRQIGEGGMGVVYQAEQENPRRVVALKVIKPGVAGARTLRRFEHEAHVLGRLQHPGIAQIFEAGTADTGQGPQPFFAMEFIEGWRLTDYAERSSLGTRERLAMFAKVCDAVQHAHLKGVIHRDLKPGNILVDGAGQPKILDFGVARVTDRDMQLTTLGTDIGQLIGTVPYMSPEQASGDPSELDTRSDVYSLGVTLYELLAGRLPYDVTHKIVPEALRIIRDEEPTPLSSINRLFRGDVETIVAKALEKDVQRRYQSAADMAADINRYLRDEPIAARPAGTWYQLHKFARRNRALVGGVVAAFAALLLGVIGTTWQAVRATRAELETREQRDEAIAAREAEQTQRETAVRIQQFLESMLAAVEPDQARGAEVTVKDVLDEAAEQIETELPDQPEVEAAVRTTIAHTYRSLGLLHEAEPHLWAALAARRASHGDEHPDVAESMDSLAVLLTEKGDYTAAEPLCREALAMRRRLLGDEHPAVALSLNNLAYLLDAKRDYAAAEPLCREVLAMRRKLLGDEHLDVAVSLNNLAMVLARQGDYAGAEPLFREALAMYRTLLGDEHTQVALSLNNLAVLLRIRDDYAGAEPLFREALAMRRRLLPNEHPDLAASLNNLAMLLRAQGDYAGAEPLFREALAMFRKSLGDEHPSVATSLNNLAMVLKIRGDYAAAEPLLLESYSVLTAGGAERDEASESTLRLIIDLYETWGKPEQAAEWRAKLPATHSGPAEADEPP